MVSTGSPSGECEEGVDRGFEGCAVLSKLVGRTVTYRDLSFDEDRRAMVEAGVPDAIAEMNAGHSA
jgi:hypothetical protein